MKIIAFLTLFLLISDISFGGVYTGFGKYDQSQNLIKQQKDSLCDTPGIAVYPEFIGKGFFSFNADFPINFNNRLSIGLTWLDYAVEDYYVGSEGIPTAGVMYYYLFGKSKSFLELGGGFSLYHRPGLNFNDDSPLSLHGVIGYRYQKKNGLLFRAGFTPFKRINNWFLPLIGVSVGYSW